MFIYAIVDWKNFNRAFREINNASSWDKLERFRKGSERTHLSWTNTRNYASHREFRQTILGDVSGILRLTRGIETTTTMIERRTIVIRCRRKATRFFSAYPGEMQVLLRNLRLPINCEKRCFSATPFAWVEKIHVQWLEDPTIVELGSWRI